MKLQSFLLLTASLVIGVKRASHGHNHGDHSTDQGHDHTASQDQHQGHHPPANISREEKFFLFTPEKGFGNATIHSTLARSKYCGKDDNLVMNMHLFPDAIKKGFTFYPDNGPWNTTKQPGADTKLDLSLIEDSAKALKLTNVTFSGLVQNSSIIQFPIKLFSPEGLKGNFEVIFKLSVTCGTKEPFVSMDTTCPDHPSPTILVSRATINLPTLLPLLILALLK